MELADAVRARRMVRRTTAEPVDPAAIDRILALARRAPSAGHSQGQSFVVVTDEGTRRRIAEACREPEYVARGFDPWLSVAPVHVIPCVRRGAYVERYAEPDKAASTKPDEWEVPFWWVDGGAALMLLLLGAVDEGLAAGFLAIESQPIRDILGIPEDVDPLGLVPIGHPAADRRSGSLARGRRPAREVVHRERWSAGEGWSGGSARGSSR
jgi:nitroreductase